MNLLLDTHVLIWWMQGSKRIGPRAKAAMFEDQARLWLSAASIWEMAIKCAIGRLSLDAPLEKSVPFLSRQGVRSLPISVGHALAAGALPAHHADPFDRMLIAQAQCEDLVLVTVDPAMEAYEVRTLDASR
jgi:PIN domain nuclease of toxin-antitoxin system